MPFPSPKPGNVVKLLPWQIEPFRDISPVLLLTGSAGGGKSYLACAKVDGFCRKYPGAMGVFLRKTRESIVNSTVLFFERQFVANDSHVKHSPSKHRFEYTNGSMIAYGGMKDEAQREQIRSIGLDGAVDIAFLEEANKFYDDDYNEIITRMRGNAAPWTQLILGTNPDTDTHWIYRRLILQADKDPDLAVYFSRADMNTHNPPAYQDRLNALTGVLRKRLRDGIWCRAEGIIYDMFDQNKHIIKPFKIPPDWKRIRSIDFGFANAFCCQWWAVSPEDTMYLYRELYGTKKLVSDWAKEIHRLSEDEVIEKTICDHDAEARATLDTEGIRSIAADKRVQLGIQKVQERMRDQEDDKPGMYFFDECVIRRDGGLTEKYLPTCTTEEIPAYIWEPSVEGRASKEEPQKKNDHGCDAMRYAVMYVDKPRRGLFLW